MIIATIIGGAASVVAAAVTSFDINKRLNDRQERKMEKLKNICPHATLVDVKEKGENKEDLIRTLYHRPNADSEFTCSQCGKIAVSQEAVKSWKHIIENQMRQNPFFITEKNDKFQEGLKKLGLL